MLTTSSLLVARLCMRWKSWSHTVYHKSVCMSSSSPPSCHGSCMHLKRGTDLRVRKMLGDWTRSYESPSSRHLHRRIYRHSDSNVKREMTFCSNQFVQTETMFLRVSFLQSRKQATISGAELMTLSCPVLRQTNWLTKISSIESFSKTCIKNNHKF